jgi:adenylate cyclase class 2
MGTETEIKLRIDDVKGFRAALKKLRAREVFGGTGRVREWNMLFDTPQDELKKRGQLLRIRAETPERPASKRFAPETERVLLTFKRPIRVAHTRTRAFQRGRHKVREEIELEVSDAGRLASILQGLGMRGWFRYEKFRTTFRLPKSQRWAKGLLIELDETPIGTFAELEGPAEAIDRVAKKLGFSKRDYIVTNYLSLYLQECRRRGERAGDMVFPKQK